MPEFLGLPYCRPARVSSMRDEMISKTQNLKRIVITSDAHKWVVELTLGPTYEGDGRLIAHRARMASDGEFEIVMPQPMGATYSVTGTVQVSGASGAGALTTSGTFAMKTGRFISLESDPKVYVVTADRSSGDLSIYPTLRKTASNKAVNFNPNLICQYALDGRDGIEWLSNGLVVHTLGVEEA